MEISTACILFACNIRIYIQNYGYYKLYNEFNPQIKNNKHIDSDIINILFINNNHFQLLIKNDYKKNAFINDIIKSKNLYILFKEINNDKKKILIYIYQKKFNA